MNVNEILEERKGTHGSFEDNASFMQPAKELMRQSRNWNSLSNTQKEALEMIIHKIGRIVSGNANHKDHWDDIGGYAELEAKILHENNRTN